MRARWWILGLVTVVALGCGGGGDGGEDIILPFTDVKVEDGGMDVVSGDTTLPEDGIEGDTEPEMTGDPCDPNPCTTPPADACDADGVTLWMYAAEGTCEVVEGAASCDYEQTAFNCADDLGACLEGECIEVIEDPCDPNPCQNAPEPVCDEDGLILTTCTGPGTCADVEGAPDCSYDCSDTDCSESDQVCANGACVDPCDPNPCTEPPAAECKGDGSEILLTFEVPGACTYDGEIACDYTAIEYDCEDDMMICAEGECVLQGEGNTPSVAGQIIVSEFMAKSQGGSDKGEWIELYGLGGEYFDLNGCFLKDAGSDSHEIAGTLIVPAGGFVVLARSGEPVDNHGLEPDYVYGGNSLSNSGDEIILECGGVVIDELVYTSALVVEGVAAQLKPEVINASSSDNDNMDDWCGATVEFGDAGKLGTPGEFNTACAEPDPCVPNPCNEPPADDCADGLTLNVYAAQGSCENVDGVAECTYAIDPYNCADDNQVCKDGVCADPPADPCDPNPCTEAPANACNDTGTGYLTVPLPGACTPDNGLANCNYVVEEVACEAGVETCVDGACAPLGAGDMPTVAGQIIVSEFMARSQSGTDNGEWVELYNTTDAPLDLDTCHLMDLGSDDKTIEGTLVVPAKGYVVLARSDDAAANHGLEFDYIYGGYTLSNSDDEIILKCGDVEIDQVVYAAEQVILGAAWALSADQLDGTANDDMANWCVATEVYGTADKLGTPGAANAVCPEPDPCDPNPCNDAPADECDIDGLLLSQYPATGVCTNVDGAASCEYTATIVDCTDTDQKCDGGMCVSACDPNPCTNPPAASCDEDGVTLTTYPAEGACTAIEGVASCDYQGTTTNCADDGKICVEGACVVSNLPDGPTQVGDLIVTEFMPKSMGGTDTGEWVELHNPTGTAFNLNGCVLRDDDTDSYAIETDLVVEAGAYVLFARSDVEVENHGLPTPQVVYAGAFQLANSSDEVALQCGDVTIDHLAYDAAWVLEGSAIQLDPDFYNAADNDNLASWCTATSDFGTAGKKGTPGAANVDCVL